MGRRLKHAHEVLWISNGPWVNQVAPFENIGSISDILLPTAKLPSPSPPPLALLFNFERPRKRRLKKGSLSQERMSHQSRGFLRLGGPLLRRRNRKKKSQRQRSLPNSKLRRMRRSILIQSRPKIHFVKLE